MLREAEDQIFHPTLLAEMFLKSGMLRDDRPDRRIHRFIPEETSPEAAEPQLKKPVASVGG